MNDDFQGLKAWVPSFKFGFKVFLVFLLACFVYGWLMPFSFWHAYADAGLNSAIAHAIYYGVFAGPMVFALGAVIAKFALKK
jgi:hypothetical protein